MSADVVDMIDQMVIRGVIAPDQKSEVLSFFLEYQEALKSHEGYKWLELMKKSIPEKMQKIGNLNYEDATLLGWAVQTSNVKRFGAFFGQQK